MHPDRPLRRDDEGFALVEVLVALGVFLVVMVAVLPQVLAGLRGTSRAGQLTEQKGVVEAELELMRNLPWHVAPNAGQFIDVLDRYHPDLAPPSGAALVNATTCAGVPVATWTGYVKTTARCSYEPATGAFYRTVKTIDPAGPGSYVLVVDTQFLESAAPTAPASYGPAPAGVPAAYDTAVQGLDSPLSQQVGVTVTAFDLRLSQPRPVTDYTQIAEDVRSPERVLAVAEATAVELTGVTRGQPDAVPAVDGTSITLTAGRLDLAGHLAKIGTASARLSGVEARWSTDDPVGLQTGRISAPPTTAIVARTDAIGGDLGDTGSCGYACWSGSQTSAITVSADDGLPTVGYAAVPVLQAGVESSATALTFSNTGATDRDFLRQADLGLRPGRPLVSVDGSSTTLSSGCGGTGSGDALVRGYATTSPTAVSTCAEAASSTVSLFPTDLHPDGVLQVRLNRARSTCSSAHGGSRTATATYSVTVTVNGTATTTKTYTETSTAADLAGFQAMLTLPIGGGLTLADYVGAWSLAAPASSTSTPSTASASVPAALIVTSTDLRNNEAQPAAAYTRDESSAVTLRLGAVSCQALDAR